MRPDVAWKWRKWTFGFWTDPSNWTRFGIDFGPLEIVWRRPGVSAVKLFVVYPGYVISQGDFERHWITAGQVMDLHRVRPEECFVLDERDPLYDVKRRSLGDILDRLMPLVPLASGIYRPVSEREREMLRDAMMTETKGEGS